MISIVINASIIIGLIYFSMIFDRKKTVTDVTILSRFFLIGIFQSIVAIILFFMQYTKNLVNPVSKLYLFAMILLFISIFNYCISFPDNKTLLPVKLISRALILVATFFCFFYLKTVNIIDTTKTQISADDFFNTSVLSYHFLFMIILPLVGIAILVVRALFTENKILRFQMFLSTIVLLSAILFFFILVFASTFSSLLIFLYPIVTIYIIFTLYFVSFVNQVFSIHKILIAIRFFFVHYIFFGILASLLFTFILFCFTTNFLVFGLLGLASFFVLLFLHVSFRKKKKIYNDHHLSDYSFAFKDFFSKINYNADSADIMESVGNAFVQHLNASSIEFFVSSTDFELTIAVSTRNFTDEIIDTKNPLFDTLFALGIFILSRPQISTIKKLSDVRQDLNTLFTNCDSETMIFIRDDRHVLGIISLGKKKRSNEYSDFDLDVLNNLYPYFFVFGYFIKNSLKQSLMGTIDREIEFSDQIIQSIQKNMDKITHPNLDVGYISHSTRNLGGDFIDFIRLTESRHMFILGDVSGKGLNASMCMIILKSLMRTFLSETSDFIELIEKVNKFIRFNLPRGTFFAGTFMIIDFHDNVLYYINCGIPGIFLYTESYNNVIEIQGGGKVLGFVKDVSKLVKVRKIKLNPGDIILTCTDGLMDSVSLRGELYGKRRVQTILLENRSYSAEKITQFIHDDLLEFTTKGLQDDISIIALKFL